MSVANVMMSCPCDNKLYSRCVTTDDKLQTSRSKFNPPGIPTRQTCRNHPLSLTGLKCKKKRSGRALLCGCFKQ